MEINWSIAGWIIAVLVLYTIGFYEGRANGYKRRKRDEEQEKLANPPAPVKVDDPGMLRVKNENGTLTLDLDGARANASALSPEQRKRLREILTQMRPWIMEEPSAAQTTPPPPPPVMPAPAKPASPTPQPTRQTAPAGTASAKEERPTTPATSIVAQIDAILQERIAGTPLQERKVFLSQSLEGGVNVHVGVETFAGIDDVTDAEIKSVIRAAIKEWEKKYTPGL